MLGALRWPSQPSVQDADSKAHATAHDGRSIGRVSLYREPKGG